MNVRDSGRSGIERNSATRFPETAPADIVVIICARQKSKNKSMGIISNLTYYVMKIITCGRTISATRNILKSASEANAFVAVSGTGDVNP